MAARIMRVLATSLVIFLAVWVEAEGLPALDPLLDLNEDPLESSEYNQKDFYLRYLLSMPFDAEFLQRFTGPEASGAPTNNVVDSVESDESVEWKTPKTEVANEEEDNENSDSDESADRTGRNGEFLKIDPKSMDSNRFMMVMQNYFNIWLITNGGNQIEDMVERVRLLNDLSDVVIVMRMGNQKIAITAEAVKEWTQNEYRNQRPEARQPLQIRSPQFLNFLKEIHSEYMERLAKIHRDSSRAKRREAEEGFESESVELAGVAEQRAKRSPRDSSEELKRIIKNGALNDLIDSYYKLFSGIKSSAKKLDRDLSDDLSF